MADNSRIEDLRRRVQKDPASIAFAQLAEELRRAGRSQEAVDACRAGLAVHPSYLSARVTLGRALVELNELDRAEAELEVVLRNAPENLAALRSMGDIYLRRGQDGEALAQFRAALAIARNDPDLEQTVADLARKVEPKKPSASAEGLSASDFLKQLPVAPVVPIAPPAAVPVHAEPTPRVTPEPAVALPLPAAAPDSERVRAERTVAALECWLEAIHVARADRSA